MFRSYLKKRLKRVVLHVTQLVHININLISCSISDTTNIGMNNVTNVQPVPDIFTVSQTATCPLSLHLPPRSSISDLPEIC